LRDQREDDFCDGSRYRLPAGKNHTAGKTPFTRSSYLPLSLSISRKLSARTTRSAFRSGAPSEAVKGLAMIAPVPKPTVVIHTNDQQMIAALVGAHSLKSRSRSPDRFDVRILRLEDTPALCKRDGQKFIWWEGLKPNVWRRRDLQSFQPLRRMVPAMLNFRGRALVIDPDVFAVGDVWELLSREMDDRAILCCQKAEWREGRRLNSSAVMLLDCERLTHWRWEEELEELFALKRELGAYLALLDEAPQRIGHLEDEWNHCDTLTPQTKLLHITRIETQPWKTGLLADHQRHAPPPIASRETLKRLARRILRGPPRQTPVHQAHPDSRQEKLFFTMLKECLDYGTITPRMVRKAMRKNYLRRDALTLLDGLPSGRTSIHM